MGKRFLKIAVTPPAFCKSELLCKEILRLFPDVQFNKSYDYLEGKTDTPPPVGAYREMAN